MLLGTLKHSFRLIVYYRQSHPKVFQRLGTNKTERPFQVKFNLIVSNFQI